MNKGRNPIADLDAGTRSKIITLALSGHRTADIANRLGLHKSGEIRAIQRELEALGRRYVTASADVGGFERSKSVKRGMQP
jgi:IS30 family transposase